MPQTQNSADLADTINSISQGGGSIPEPKDVNFYDYDGTLLYGYTFAEAAESVALPMIPIHAGLTAQGWNYSHEQIVSAAQNGKHVTAGTVYTTSDASTRLFLFVAKGSKIPNLKIYVKMAANTSAVVDWGDGTTGTLSNTGSSAAVVYAEKTSYAEAPDDITLCVKIIGGSFSVGNGGSENVFGINPNNDAQIKNSPVLIKAQLGSNCTGIEANAFNGCSFMTAVSISQSVTAIGNSVFVNCSRLHGVVIPSSVINVESNVFYNANSLTVVSIPESVTQLNAYLFQSCYSLKHFSIPSSVTSIGTRAFQSVYGVEAVSLQHSITAVDIAAFRDCNNLVRIDLSQNMTAISSELFYNCKCLLSVRIPHNIASIGSNAFYNCCRLYAVDLTAYTDPTAIPTLASANAFQNTPDYMKIRVANQEMLTAFSSATNWSSHASKIVIA